MDEKAEPKWLKPAVDYGPLVIFLITYWTAGFMVATAAIMVCALIALAVSYALTRHIPPMPLITAGIIGVFGGLTLYFNDETFFKMKPTIVQVLFTVILWGGLFFNKALLAPLFDKSWPMDKEGLRKLTFRFGLFFLVMAGLNEVVWRTQSTDFWVYFKIFGILGLTFVFAASQAPLMMRHRLPEEGASEPPGSADSPNNCKPLEKPGE